MKTEALLACAMRAFPSLSRDEVYAAILCGEIYVGGERLRDPSARVSPAATIEQRRRAFVSRGGLKLDHALESWRISVTGKVMLDAGSSTGGFTDCLLQRGALRVHAVDVGYNQLAYSLRTDPRVIVHERTNIMDLASLDPAADAAVADLSFRSLRGAADRILSLTREGWVVALVKPQFELRRDYEGFDGVLRDDRRLIEVLEEVAEALRSEGVSVTAALRSPIEGRRGNREYLFLLRRGDASEARSVAELLGGGL